MSSYDALRGGCTAEAMEDFTGGLTELVDLGAKAPTNIFAIMEHALNRATLMACSIDADPHEIEANGPLGLILGHAYSVTDIRQVNFFCNKCVIGISQYIYILIDAYQFMYIKMFKSMKDLEFTTDSYSYRRIAVMISTNFSMFTFRILSCIFRTFRRVYNTSGYSARVYHPFNKFMRTGNVFASSTRNLAAYIAAHQVIWKMFSLS